LTDSQITSRAARSGLGAMHSMADAVDLALAPISGAPPSVWM
jgi:hypothetical protein